MLRELSIKNFALIEELHISLDKGLNILTGETGAGKSIIIGAIGLVLGEKASSEVIRKGSDLCEIRGLFEVKENIRLKEMLAEKGLLSCKEEEFILKRELSRQGRGRCFLNSQIITLGMLEEIGNYLVDVHGQHEHQALLKPGVARDLLDEFGVLMKLRKRTEQTYRKFREKSRELEELRASEKEREQQIDLYQFQIKEIDQANLSIEEEEVLEREHKVLSNAEKLGQLSQELYHHLYEGTGSITEKTALVERDLEKIVAIDQALKDELKELGEVKYRIDEMAIAIRDYRRKIEFNPQRLEEILERKELISKLKRKYGNTIKDILNYRKETQVKLDKLLNSAKNMEETIGEVERLQEELARQAGKLSGERKIAGAKLKKKMEQELKELGMGKARFDVEINQGEIKSSGMDEIRFLVAPNVGEDLKPINQIASGGEISRIMLALKTILARADQIPTLIFDEIDAAIGGKIAQVVGRKMKTLSPNHQVICITHLPQIAVFASSHYFVDKKISGGRTKTMTALLDKKGKESEIARMLSGEQLTEITLKHAREMIREGQS
ncbi:MAG TPA: DNA repair protein RecN [bacterium]|nr:DNA repair protein RecN [bacterium]